MRPMVRFKRVRSETPPKKRLETSPGTTRSNLLDCVEFPRSTGPAQAWTESGLVERKGLGAGVAERADNLGEKADSRRGWQHPDAIHPLPRTPKSFRSAPRIPAFRMTSFSARP